MRHFLRLAEGIDVSELAAELTAKPHLWNQRRERTFEASPHHGVDDIWIRYRALHELTEPAKYLEPHFAEFYPAWRELPSLHPIIFNLMAKVRATYLGGILITRIPPGGQVKPHHDRGSWHAETMNCKMYVPIEANPDCVNHCEDEQVVMRPGECWSFNNLVVHSVENRGKTPRVTAIICCKVEE